MDRSRRQAAKESVAPPQASRLTLKPRRHPNRRRPGSIWARVPSGRQVADACGRALRRSLPAVIVGIVLAAVGGSAWAGYRFVTTSPRFAITEIAVRGNHHLTADQIRADLPVRIGGNVFAADLDRAVRRLRANPWIESATARRVLPHTVIVEVREHEPAAVVELGGLYLVDASGHPFKRADLAAGDGAGLPVVTGIGRAAYLADPEATAARVRAALDALATWRAEPARPAIGEVHLDPAGALALHTYDGATEIELGALDADLPARMQTFDAAWTALGDAERARARAVHLDARPDHVTVAFKDQ